MGSCSSMPSAEQTQTWNKGDWTNALSRSTDKPSMEYCEDQKGTIINIRAVQGHSQRARINLT